MEEHLEFYNAIMQRKEKVGIKKWEKHFTLMYYDKLLQSFNSASTIIMENIFHSFTLAESVKFELIEYDFEDDKHIFKIKSLYTGNTLIFKFKYNYSIT